MFLPKKILLLPFFLLFLVAFSQNSTNIDTQATPLLENIHLHLNKTTFFKGENLWFKAYVQDQLNGVPASTTNLHVGVFSKDGKLLHKKMFLLSEGIGLGDFKIDSTFVDESYTLMAWTNYMKNFKEATPFLQNINILGNSEETVPEANTGLTVKLYPEGQKLLSGAFNTVALLVYDHKMQPVESSAIQLVTADGALIQSNIQTNAFGQGRFSFFADSGRRYLLKIKDTEGGWVTKEIEVQDSIGIGLGVKNEADNIVLLIPKAPASNLETVENSSFTLAIYHKGASAFSQEYSFGNDPAAVSIDRSYLPKGINTAVIFDEEMQPLAKRLFYNNGGLYDAAHPVAVRYRLNENRDSLKLSFRLPTGHPTANLSVSVLPANTKAYTPNNTISSSFFLQPYLSKQLVRGGYFFDGKKRSRSYQLDTRLLMEESGVHDWNFLNSTQNMPYRQEQLITLKGKITDANTEKEKQVSVLTKALGNLELLELSSNKDFGGNLPLFEGDSLLVSVLNGKGKLRMPKAKLYFDQTREPFFDYSTWLKKASNFDSGTAQMPIEQNLNLSDRAVLLDEVIISAKVEKPTRFTLGPEIEGRIINKATLKKHSTFAAYIRKLGFQTRPDARQGGIGVFVFDPPGLHPVPVYVEGMQISPNEIMNMPLSGIKSMTYHKYVRPHQGPFISISIRFDYDELNGRGKFASFPISKGFSRVQTYFTPLYPDYVSPLYKRYGAIWWEGQVKADAEVFTTITVPLNGQEEVLVIVEGMSFQGLLYQAKQICNPFLYSEED